MTRCDLEVLLNSHDTDHESLVINICLCYVIIVIHNAFLNVYLENYQNKLLKHKLT